MIDTVREVARKLWYRLAAQMGEFRLGLAEALRFRTSRTVAIERSCVFKASGDMQDAEQSAIRFTVNQTVLKTVGT